MMADAVVDVAMNVDMNSRRGICSDDTSKSSDVQRIVTDSMTRRKDLIIGMNTSKRGKARKDKEEEEEMPKVAINNVSEDGLRAWEDERMLDQKLVKHLSDTQYYNVGVKYRKASDSSDSSDDEMEALFDREQARLAKEREDWRIEDMRRKIMTLRRMSALGEMEVLGYDVSKPKSSSYNIREMIISSSSSSSSSAESGDDDDAGFKCYMSDTMKQNIQQMLTKKKTKYNKN